MWDRSFQGYVGLSENRIDCYLLSFANRRLVCVLTYLNREFYEASSSLFCQSLQTLPRCSVHEESATKWFWKSCWKFLKSMVLLEDFVVWCLRLSMFTISELEYTYIPSQKRKRQLTWTKAIQRTFEMPQVCKQDKQSIVFLDWKNLHWWFAIKWCLLQVMFVLFYCDNHDINNHLSTLAFTLPHHHSNMLNVWNQYMAEGWSVFDVLRDFMSFLSQISLKPIRKCCD